MIFNVYKMCINYYLSNIKYMDPINGEDKFSYNIYSILEIDHLSVFFGVEAINA